MKLAPSLPTHEEAEKIIPMIKEVFENAKVNLETIGEHPMGGVMAKAEIPEEKKEPIQNELFSKGIVLVEIERGTLGFAVCR